MIVTDFELQITEQWYPKSGPRILNIIWELIRNANSQAARRSIEALG